MTDPHRECWELLPWLVTDRLSKDEAARLERHLHECDACQEELESQRRLRDAVRSEEALVLAPQASFAKLMRRIDEAANADESADVRGEPAPANVAAVVRPSPNRRVRWLAVAACVQGIAIVGLLGTVWLQSSTQPLPADYPVRGNATVVPFDRPTIRIVFADGIALDRVNELLQSIDAQIIDGPSAAGVYRLQVAAARDEASADAVARDLRADRRVRFAERGFPEVGRQ